MLKRKVAAVLVVSSLIGFVGSLCSIDGSGSEEVISQIRLEKKQKMEKLIALKQTALDSFNQQQQAKVEAEVAEFRRVDDQKYEQLQQQRAEELAKEQAEKQEELERRQEEARKQAEEEAKRDLEVRRQQKHEKLLKRIENETSLDSRAMMIIKAELQDYTLIECDKIDLSYCGSKIELSKEDREILRRLIVGEAGNQGLVGMALVAQTIHDNLEFTDWKTVEEVRVENEYSGRLDSKDYEDPEIRAMAEAAIVYVFDQGGVVVQHRLMAFYSPKGMEHGVASWHETLPFVLRYGGHKFFDWG